MTEIAPPDPSLNPEQSGGSFFRQIQEAIFLGASLGEDVLRLEHGSAPNDFQARWSKDGVWFGLRVFGAKSALQKVERDPLENIWSITTYLYDIEMIRFAELKTAYTDEEYVVDGFEERVRADVLAIASQGLASGNSDAARALIEGLRTALQCPLRGREG